MIKFFFFLPVHNGGIYLHQCVQSILSQSYKNFELIIFNNFSTDNSLDFLCDIRDPQIRVIDTKEKLDICDSWDNINKYTINNIFCEYDFMILVGHDDYFSKDYLKSILLLIENYPQASVYNTHFNLVDSNSKFIRRCKPFPKFLNYMDYLNLRCWNHIDIFGTGYAFRVNDFKLVGGINITFPLLLFSDDLLFTKLSKLSFMVISDSTEYYYRVHNSTSNINNFIFGL